MRSCHFGAALDKCYQAVLIEAIFKRDWLHNDVSQDSKMQFISEVTGLRHNTFATLARSNETEFGFHFFYPLYAFEFSDHAQ